MSGQCRDEFFVAFRIRSPQAMIEVQHGEANPLLRAYFAQNPKQGH